MIKKKILCIIPQEEEINQLGTKIYQIGKVYIVRTYNKIAKLLKN